MIRIFIIILFTLSHSALASYVITNMPSSYQTNPSFKSEVYEFYSSGSSGSVSVYSGPRDYYYQFPNGIWVPARNGYIPRNSIIKEYINGRPLYYCRSLYNNIIYYGVLVPDQGCFVQNHGNATRLTNYDTLITY